MNLEDALFGPCKEPYFSHLWQAVEDGVGATCLNCGAGFAPVPTVADTLAERETTYGEFADYAVIANKLQDVMISAQGWYGMSADKQQALLMIAAKIARILNGNPNYRDNWLDIGGYAKLAEDRCAVDKGGPAK